MIEESLKARITKTAWQILLIILGSGISAGGISLLLEQHKMLTTGVSGISLLISYFIPVNPGILIMLFNIPLFIVAWKRIDFHFCLYSIIGVASLSVMMVLFDTFHTSFFKVENKLLAAIFGGILCGGGTGIVIRARGSHGGTDIISVVLRQKFSLGIGMIGFYINLIIVAILTIKFGLEIGLLTIFSQYLSARSLDRVVTGLNTAKSIMIVSDRHDEIAEYIKNRMYRGVTFIEGEGGYEGRAKKVIWCVVTTSQLSQIKSAMKKIDPNAFMAITDSSEIIGQGFYRSPL